MKRYLVALFTLSIFVNAMDYTNAMVPENLHVYNTAGAIYVDMHVDACTGKRYYLSSNNKNYESIYSMLLAAQISQRKVVLRYDGCTNRGSQGKIVGVYLK